jgi:rubredoxin
VSAKPETVVHVAARTNWMEVPEEQLCADCGFTLWHGEPGWPKEWKEGALVGVRIDTTFKDGFVVGYFPIGERDLEDDERRCTVSS